MNTQQIKPQCNNRSIMKTIEAKLIDFTTNQPIVDAHVYVRGSSTSGVATDNKGVFSLNVYPGDQIIISHLLYGKQIFRQDQITPVIYLDPLIQQLDPVVIQPIETPKQTKDNKYIMWFGLGLLGVIVARLLYDSKESKKGSLATPNKTVEVNL